MYFSCCVSFLVVVLDHSYREGLGGGGGGGLSAGGFSLTFALLLAFVAFCCCCCCCYCLCVCVGGGEYKGTNKYALQSILPLSDFTTHSH